MSLLTNKVVITTGASSGIGRAAAILLAREDANVVIGARREDMSAYAAVKAGRTDRINKNTGD